MSEKRQLQKKEIAYKGIFRADELYQLIRDSCSRRGYFVIEKKAEENVLKDGKLISNEFAGSKNMNEYAKTNMKFDITMRNLKDKLVKMDGQQQKFQEGEVKIKITAELESDRRSKWENSGFKLVLRTVMDKFIRKDISTEMMMRGSQDCTDIAEDIKAYLNMHRFKLKAPKADDD